MGSPTSGIVKRISVLRIVGNSFSITITGFSRRSFRSSFGRCSGTSCGSCCHWPSLVVGSLTVRVLKRISVIRVVGNPISISNTGFSRRSFRSGSVSCSGSSCGFGSGS